LRTASFTSPATLCAAPFALSILHSVSSFLSPVTLPAASLIAPLALSAAPFTCSLSIRPVLLWLPRPAGGQCGADVFDNQDQFGSSRRAKQDQPVGRSLPGGTGSLRGRSRGTCGEGSGTSTGG